MRTDRTDLSKAFPEIIADANLGDGKLQLYENVRRDLSRYGIEIPDYQDRMNMGLGFVQSLKTDTRLTEANPKTVGYFQGALQACLL